MNKLDRLRDYYDTTDQTDAIADAEIETDTPEVLVSTSIRLPKALMDRVRQRAAATGIPATTLMRQWIVDRLDDHDPTEQVVSVGDLEQFIASRSHPTRT
jgi:predicted DNA binding CopG/RHH family protein